MKLVETPLSGLFVIEPEPITDNRGFFARLYCAQTFKDLGLNPTLDQISLSYNEHNHTLRGLHIQRPPHLETKVVRVTRGAIFDVAVDVRRGSPTYGKWHGVELTAANRRQFYIPDGFAHGFQTLAPDTEVLYHISVPYVADAATGIRYDDPQLAISWPDSVMRVMSERDQALPLLSDFEPV